MAQDRLIWKIVLDFVVLVCVAFPLLAIRLWVEPHHRGYFPDDMSLRLPYREQSISEALLASIGFSLNIITIIIIEVLRDKQGKGVGEKFLSGNLITGWIWESYSAIGIFIFGAACQQLTVNVTKNVIGRLRPFFYDVCRPVPDVTSPLNSLGYIQDYTCTGTDESQFQDMRLSFPSGHSSFAMYSAVFFILYVQVKGKWHGSKLLRHAVQYLVLMGGWYVGLSRVVENMHHWSDVAAGFLIGALSAVIVFIYVLKPKKYGAPESWHESAPPQNVLPRPILAR